jgi:hypothetical protein
MTSLHSFPQLRVQDGKVLELQRSLPPAARSPRHMLERLLSLMPSDTLEA